MAASAREMEIKHTAAGITREADESVMREHVV